MSFSYEERGKQPLAEGRKITVREFASILRKLGTRWTSGHAKFGSEDAALDMADEVPWASSRSFQGDAEYDGGTGVALYPEPNDDPVMVAREITKLGGRITRLNTQIEDDPALVARAQKKYGSVAGRDSEWDPEFAEVFFDIQ